MNNRQTESGDNTCPQCLYVEKAMAASGASPEDIAKTLLIQVPNKISFLTKSNLASKQPCFSYKAGCTLFAKKSLCRRPP